MPLEQLLTFAVRQNPKRGFLFVSKVLGKHIPIAPSLAAATHQALAKALPPLQSAHFVGLAETATALAEGVYWQWRQLTKSYATFQHTTRYLSDWPLLLRFDEPHSHAPAHLLYQLVEQEQPRELVLIDDELSTGHTLQNLALAWLAKYPQTERIILLSLTDWCTRRTEIQQALGVPTEFVSLLRGSFSFEANPDWPAPQLPAVVGKADNKGALLPTRSARYGMPYQLFQLSEATLAKLALPEISDGSRLLVLGTGEFQYPAFALAEQLAAHGYSCQWSATTRSPILPLLAIQNTFHFTDNVGDNIPNYLYNVFPDNYDHILVCYEGNCQPDAALMQQLGPQARACCLLPLEGLK